MTFGRSLRRFLLSFISEDLLEITKRMVGLLDRVTSMLEHKHEELTWVEDMPGRWHLVGHDGAPLGIDGVPLHVVAIEVCGATLSPQRAANEALDVEFSGLCDLATGIDGPFAEVEIGGRRAVVVCFPHSGRPTMVN